MTLSSAEQVIARARAAQPDWAALTPVQRCKFLGDLRQEIAMQCESIADLIARETSKPRLDALSGDVLVALEHLRYYETYAPHILRPGRIGKPFLLFRGAKFERSYEPHGVALIFGPSNYPFQLSVVPLVTALAAGNAVILKCSERTPATSCLIRELCEKARLPRDLVQVLSDEPDISAELIDARPDFILFTGSSRNGQKVAERAAAYLIPTVLELGGKDAGLVFADCNLDRAVEGITYGAFSNAGRVCVAVKRCYVETAIYAEFLRRLQKRIATLRVSEELESDLCPLPAEARREFRLHVEDALQRGAQLDWPPDRSSIDGEPVLLSNVPLDALILNEESFGPVLCVAPFRDEAEALALANSSGFALGSSVWTRNQSRARRVASKLSAGSCSVNDVIRNIANPYAAFGGNSRSGFGRYHGPEGLQAFSKIKTLMLSKGARKHQINWFPFRERTRRQLAGWIRFRHKRGRLGVQLSRWFAPLLLCVFVPTVLSAQSARQAHLSINVKLTPGAHGELAYLVFASPDGFPGDRDKAVKRGFQPINASSTMRIEVDLPPGTYAVSVYEDLNGNHKLDHNFLGIPTEPVGVSNNPPVRHGPPRYGESAFQLNAPAQTIDITLVKGI
jgi:4,4'-diapolycopenoate synthase